MMSDEDLGILAEDILDFCDALESAVVKLRAQIQKMLGSDVKRAWNPDAVKWQQAEGSRGPYERSEDVNNLEFKAMVKDLAEHNGRLTREGFFYWLFKNGATVGRKKQGVSR